MSEDATLCRIYVLRLFGVCTVRRVPPHFSVLPENVEVPPGGSVNLTCVAVGEPMPFVRWKLGTLQLTPEGSIPVGKNVLMLNDVRQSATYTCVAESTLGVIEFDAEVQVTGWIFFLFFIIIIIIISIIALATQTHATAAP